MIQTKQQVKQQDDEYQGFPADIAKQIESIRQSIAARSGREKENEEPHKTAPIIRLPLWPEAVRGAPNDVLRSALFAAIQGKDRQHLENRLIASVDGIRIKYTGVQLEQSDLDVWEQVLHLARKNPVVFQLCCTSLFKCLQIHSG